MPSFWDVWKNTTQNPGSNFILHLTFQVPVIVTGWVGFYIKLIAMKPRSIFCVFAAVCLLASCSKDPVYDPGSDDSDAMLKARPVSGPVILLPPSGGDDTDALLAAIAAAPPRTTIQLSVGEYHFRPLEIRGFNGIIKGAGRGKTFLMPYGLIEAGPQYDLNLMPSWWHILGGNVTISDLAFNTEDGSMLEDIDPYFNKALACLIIVNNYNFEYQFDNPQPMAFNFVNVDVLGGSIDPAIGSMGLPYNVIMALWFGTDVWVPSGPLPLCNGTIKITNCTFYNVGQGFEAIGCGDKTTMHLTGNRTENVAWGTFFTGMYGSEVILTGNTFNGASIAELSIGDWDWGLTGDTDFPDAQSVYFVTGNTFNTSHEINSLILRDDRGVAAPDLYLPTRVLVKNNRFNLCEGSTGISCINSLGVQVRNNYFKGNAVTGVRVDGGDVYNLLTGAYCGIGDAKNNLIQGNNFSALSASESDIFLGERSSQCIVLGNGKESVIDLGTNNNIVGMKKIHGGQNPGLIIRDNFRMIHHMRR